ncbi:MAG: hypothetical protein ACLFRG_04955 [Desulfococcaceae bacterium]
MAPTSLGTHLPGNNAAAAPLLPIAISTAAGTGVDPKPFIIGVIFGAGACQATPIGYKTNLPVYGPGAYRFAAHLALGLPLNAIVLTMASLTIPLVRPPWKIPTPKTGAGAWPFGQAAFFF